MAAVTAAALALKHARLGHCSRRGIPQRAATRRPVLAPEHIFHPLFSGEWEGCDPLASTDDVFKLFARGAEVAELTALWKHVEDIMQTQVVTATPSTPMAQAHLLMRLHGIGGMPVVNAANQVVGVVCRSDVRRGGAAVKDAMSSPAVCVRETEAIPTAAALMLEHDLDRLPVVDAAGRCVGIVTRTDMYWTLVIDNDESETFLTVAR